MKKLFSWYFRGYHERQCALESGVIARFSRGNVLVQRGKYLNRDDFNRLVSRGDDAIRRLEQAG